MTPPPIPSNEIERLRELESYEILDTLDEEDYDRITELASEICESPISLISLIDRDRQWFKSRQGLQDQETPREYAFCAHAINTPDEVFQVPDARLDERFHDNPLVTGGPNVISYTGIPLKSTNGYALGTLCVIDNKPKELDENQIKALRVLADQVIHLLELRRTNKKLDDLVIELQRQNNELERFATVAAHDLKSPLNNISSLVDLFMSEYGTQVSEEGIEWLKLIDQSSHKLRSLVDGLLEYSRNKNMVVSERTDIEVSELFSDLKAHFGYQSKCELQFHSDVDSIFVNRNAIERVMINLISNALKYNDKEVAEVEVDIQNQDRAYFFSVKDNGPGIPKDMHEQIFELFKVLRGQDRFGQQGNGIGLATVKSLVESMGGEMSVSSEPGNGSIFSFTVRK